jgi:hypothetical protein
MAMSCAQILNRALAKGTTWVEASMIGMKKDVIGKTERGIGLLSLCCDLL